MILMVQPSTRRMWDGDTGFTKDTSPLVNVTCFPYVCVGCEMKWAEADGGVLVPGDLLGSGDEEDDDVASREWDGVVAGGGARVVVDVASCR